MTAGLSIRPTPAACRISTASPILPHPSLITVFRVVPTLVSHDNGSQQIRVSSLAGMAVEPSTWYSSRGTHPSIDPAHWRLTSQPCLCSNHHSTWGHSVTSVMASQITSLTIVHSTVYSGADQWKHQSSASLALVRGIHRWPVNSPHKGPVTRKMFPLDDVIMYFHYTKRTGHGPHILL